MLIMTLMFSLCWPPQADSLTWNLSSAKAAVYPGEPIELVLEALSRERIEINQSNRLPLSPCLLKVRFESLDTGTAIQGDELCLAYQDGIDLCLYGKAPNRLLLEKQWRYRAHVPITAWLSKPLDPGAYKVTMHDVGMGMDPAFSVEAAFRVLPQNAKEHKKHLAKLYAARNRHGFGERRHRITQELFTSARSEYAVPYQILCLKDPFVGNKEVQLNALRDAGTQEAAQGILNFIETLDKKAPFYSYNYAYAIRCVYAIRERGDVKLRELTENFVKMHPCPPLPKLPGLSEG